uniref:Pesticidal crystal protein cry6Aa n=2 Tax=Schizophyllum commune (strain H4-8 / FGSC 9210) TaxID=578458 RepID=D8QBX8_SCHCM
MSTARSVDLSPKGLLSDSGNYVLQQDDIASLARYVWAGVLLPGDTDTLQQRLNVSTATMRKLSEVVTPLLATFNDVKAHCETFKDKTYPSIVSIADDIYSYAQDAGGTEQNSYYANILRCIRSLATASSKPEKDDLKQTIDSLCDGLIKNATAIQTKIQEVVENVSKFGDQTYEDSSALKERKLAVEDMLTSDAGSLEALQRQLEENHTELKADQAEYEHDRIVASTALTYAWVPFLGVITSSVVAAASGRAAAAMAERIKLVNRLIAEETDEAGSRTGVVTDERRIVADLISVDMDFDSLLAAVGPATHLIQVVLAAFQAISGQLANLKDLVNTDPSKANAAIKKIVDSKVVDGWNALANAVDKYREAAFVTPVQEISLDQLSQQLQKQVGTAA